MILFIKGNNMHNQMLKNLLCYHYVFVVTLRQTKQIGPKTQKEKDALRPIGNIFSVLVTWLR